MNKNDILDKVWGFVVGAEDASGFERWVYESERLEQLLDKSLYDDIISIAYRNKHEVLDLKAKLALWIEGQLNTQFIAQERIAHLKIIWTIKSILAGSIRLTNGARIVTKLYRDLYTSQDHWDLYSVFVALESETDALPLIEQKVDWNEQAFEAKQVELHDIEDSYRAQVIKSCLALLKHHNVTNGV